jgi:hypothetical protein
VKVSKPVLIFGIVVLLLAGYIHFFTGKKKTATPVAPVPQASSQVQPTPATPAKIVPPEPPAKGSKTEAVSAPVKPDFGKLKGIWLRNPFMLPQFKEEKKKDTIPAVRLSAIFEKGKDRVAIIDREVVRKGDMVGNEKVLEIEKDKVILTRDGTKRVLSLASIEDTVREEEPKTKATEKGK